MLMYAYAIFASKSTKWTRLSAALRRRFGLPAVCLEKAGEEERTEPGEGVRLKVAATTAWLSSSATKSTLETCRGEKLKMSTIRFYNSKGSALLAEARAGVLRTRNWRAQLTEGLVATCALCGH
ncbi:hypothetical protein MTO96_043220 [Rhipicephalus appendiculatus]